MLIDVLGAEFDGVLGCDYFSAYRRYHREFGVVLQFCLAHLIRDVKYLTTLPDARDRAYGEGCARPCGGSSGDPPAGGMDERSSGAGWRRAAVCDAGVPATRASATWRSGWRRTGRAISGSSRARGGADEQPGGAGDPVRGDRPADHAGDAGRGGDRWCERIWTVMATCSQQGRSVFAYLEAAVAAWFDGEEAPSLLPRES